MCHSVFFIILCVLSAFIWRNKDIYLTFTLFKRLIFPKILLQTVQVLKLLDGAKYCRKVQLCISSVQQHSGLPWVWEFPWGFPWVWVWDGYEDYDKSPWVCGDSMGIFEIEWIPNYVETS